ncbi:TAXI family TRAP transporter solute-binding subunit [Dactylosporangium sp. AC04546]|uniref:TAXI family TRAP transporter solute-binding subunit n=1 Tax=Dactylosporangium sp. AC04546 TaxID=2862460 RepID=UPI001EDCD54D|nr:TAXI family TRAP transporter solute-binding subunit [Dactylosporangium sp. AC04546]WVK81800.1 TAXI family TRAP transporter solute-binding subunit [Dactylosporangium sp. AC04546]
MRRRALLTGAASAVLLGACESTGEEATGTLRIATGSSGAVYYKYGTAIAALARRYLPKVRPSVLQTAASEANVADLLDDSADLAFTQADIAGAGQGANPGRLAALARIYDDYIHIVVAAGGPVQRIGDLRDRRVSIGAPGSGTAVTANRILSVTGVSVQRVPLGLDESAAALKSGQVDAFFFSGGLPVSSITTLAQAFPIRLLDLQALVSDLRDNYGDYYAERVVPASTYRGINTVVAVGIANYLVVRTSMPDMLGYGVTQLLFDGRDELAKAHQAAARLNIRSAISTPPLPLHAGAARYYRDQKA